MSEYATALKVGTTGLVLQLLEEGVVPEMGLLNAVDAIRDISRDLSCAWEIQREDGRYTTAVEVQRHYLELSEQHLRGRDEESDWVLNEWRFVLDGLVHDPGSLIDCVDWIAKKWLLEQFIEAEGIDWGDPWLESLDLEYHNLNPKKSFTMKVRR